VSAPVDLGTVQLTDTFSVQTPTWRLTDLLGMAEQQNPSLKGAAGAGARRRVGVKAASSSWGPSVSLSAGWSGFTQKLSDINPTISAIRQSAQTDSLACAYENTAWLNAGQTQLNCAVLTNTSAREQALRDQNSRYPFHFTPQPFQARLTVTIPLWGNFQQPLQVSQAKAQQQDLQESVRPVAPSTDRRKPSVPDARDGVSDDRHSGHKPHRGARAAAARHGALPRRLGTFFELLDAR